MADKTFIEGSSAKAITGQYGEFFNMSFNLEKLAQYANEKGYINITMSKRKEVGQYGDTHSFTLNEWKPEQKKTEAKIEEKSL
tara:strand:- start:155 stop:403 length:249 start_codon:yes stop_codon:yes gene_type:complete